jgi:iron complex transport system permease protein
MSTQSNRYRGILPLLLGALIVTLLFSIKFGAITITVEDIYSSLQKAVTAPDQLTLTERIFLDIRLPRAIACVLVGASLSMSGVLMQGLFRNPIVEPGLIGTSSGAALGASLYFVLGATLKFSAGVWTLPIAACLGGALSTFIVFFISRNKGGGKSSVVSLLLTGIAVNALFLSGVGFLSYIARDPQARSITFWNLGTLSGAGWPAVIIIGLSSTICLLWGLRYTKHLNALMMGEDEALFLGVSVKRLQFTIITINVVLVAVATAFTGVIGFVGLIVPHFLRLMKGSDNRFLLLGSALLGGIMLSLADLAARLLLAPAELPIGIVTSLVGVPVFIYLLRKNHYYF